MESALKPIAQYIIRWNDEPHSSSLRLWPSEIGYIKEKGEYERIEVYSYRRGQNIALLECRVQQLNGKEK